jgi:hypothetical protein
VTGIATSLALIVAPLLLLLQHASVIALDDVVIQSPHPVLLPFITILGIVLLTVTLHLARGIGYLHGQLAKSLLVRDARPASEESAPEQPRPVPA